MQTFLPYPNFAMCARVLDDKLLGKQKTEAKQILDILKGKIKENYWKNHPAVRMWDGYTDLLKHYINAMIMEWKLRGYKTDIPYEKVSEVYKVPSWIYNEKLFSSHRIALVSKNPDHYGQRWKIKDINAPYWWPVPLRNKSQNKKMEKYWEKRMKKIEKRRKKSAIHKTNR